MCVYLIFSSHNVHKTNLRPVSVLQNLIGIRYKTAINVNVEIQKLHHMLLTFFGSGIIVHIFELRMRQGTKLYTGSGTHFHDRCFSSPKVENNTIEMFHSRIILFDHRLMIIVIER